MQCLELVGVVCVNYSKNSNSWKGEEMNIKKALAILEQGTYENQQKTIKIYKHSYLIAKGESEAKDATIKRMAKFISTFDTDESICKHKHEGVFDCEAEGFNCVECIIKHFSEKP